MYKCAFHCLSSIRRVVAEGAALLIVGKQMSTQISLDSLLMQEATLKVVEK